MYNCTAVVKKRYRKENLYLLRIVITSGLQKFQRREFFRIPYTTPLKYYEISEQTAQMQTTEELFAEIQKPEYIDPVSYTHLDVYKRQDGSCLGYDWYPARTDRHVK